MDLLTFAKNIADRVEAQSARAKVPVAVCVMDIHGNIILKHRDAIDGHKEFDRAFFDQCCAEEVGPATRSEVDRASDAAEKAAWKMARTKPTTAASAMLTCIEHGGGVLKIIAASC
jgi:hypothetical protein